MFNDSIAFRSCEYQISGNMISSTSMLIYHPLFGNDPIPCEWWLLNCQRLDFNTHIFSMFITGKDIIEIDPELYYMVSQKLARDRSLNIDTNQDILLNHEYEIPFRLSESNVINYNGKKCYIVSLSM